MDEIILLLAHIDGELDDAHAYATLALEYKARDPATADLFARLSEEEMVHMRSLQTSVERLLEGLRRQKGEIPADVAAVYQHLHRKNIARAEQVGVLQSMYSK